MAVHADDMKTLRNITAKIKRILKNDIPKIKDQDVKFLLGQAFMTVDTFLSSATTQVRETTKQQKGEKKNAQQRL
tara:strand:+ start:7370 stop:7594 length:225 start_codon:yes stop_codon:yes gene_type:complete